MKNNLTCTVPVTIAIERFFLKLYINRLSVMCSGNSKSTTQKSGENICGTGFQMAFNKFTYSCTSDIDLFWLDFFEFCTDIHIYISLVSIITVFII